MKNNSYRLSFRAEKSGLIYDSEEGNCGFSTSFRLKSRVYVIFSALMLSFKGFRGVSVWMICDLEIKSWKYRSIKYLRRVSNLVLGF